MFNFLKALGERLLFFARSSICTCLLTSFKSFKNFLKQDFPSQKTCWLFAIQVKFIQKSTNLYKLLVTFLYTSDFLKISVTFAILWCSDIKGILRDRFNTIFSPSKFLQDVQSFIPQYFHKNFDFRQILC